MHFVQTGNIEGVSLRCETGKALIFSARETAGLADTMAWWHRGGRHRRE